MGLLQGNHLERRMKKLENLHASFARMNVKLDWFVTVNNQGANRMIVRRQNNQRNIYREVYYVIKKKQITK